MNQARTRTDPHERFNASTLGFDLREEIESLRDEPTPTRHGHKQKTLYKHERCTVALFLMEAGGSMAEHSADGVVTVQPVAGELAMAIADEERRCKPGEIVVMAPGTKHDVRAEAECAFLLHVALVKPVE